MSNPKFWDLQPVTVLDHVMDLIDQAADHLTDCCFGGPKTVYEDCHTPQQVYQRDRISIVNRLRRFLKNPRRTAVLQQKVQHPHCTEPRVETSGGSAEDVPF